MSSTDARLRLLKVIEDAAAAAEKKQLAGSDASSAKVAFAASTPTKALTPSKQDIGSPGGPRTVTMLRPRPGLLLDGNQSVSEAARKMQSANTDAALVVSISGELTGIVTDTDVTRRVLSKHLDPSTLRICDVMTAKPACVSEEGTAFEALALMVEGRFRHLPVIGIRNGVATAVGVLDVAKCLFDAINNIEASHLPSGDTTLGALLAANSNGSAPAVGSGAVASGAAELMAARRGAVLVEAAGGGAGGAAAVTGSGARPAPTCAGILTPKDLLFRLVARGLNPDTTRVGEVMTPSPDCIVESATVLQALQQLQGSGYRQLPVLTTAGQPAGVVDVLALIQGAMLEDSGHGGSHPELIVVSGVDDDDDCVTPPRSPFVCVSPPSFDDGTAPGLLPDVAGTAPVGAGGAGGGAGPSPAFLYFKVTLGGASGPSVRLQWPVDSYCRIRPLELAVSKALGAAVGVADALPVLSHVGEGADGGQAVLTCDADLMEVVTAAKRAGQSKVALDASFPPPASRANKTAVTLLAVGGVGVLLAVAARSALAARR